MYKLYRKNCCKHWRFVQYIRLNAWTVTTQTSDLFMTLFWGWSEVLPSERLSCFLKGFVLSRVMRVNWENIQTHGHVCFSLWSLWLLSSLPQICVVLKIVIFIVKNSFLEINSYKSWKCVYVWDRSNRLWTPDGSIWCSWQYSMRTSTDMSLYLYMGCTPAVPNKALSNITTIPLTGANTVSVLNWWKYRKSRRQSLLTVYWYDAL